MSKVWMVRAGRDAFLAPEFVAQGITAIGWGEIGSLERIHARSEISELVRKAFPDYTLMRVATAAGQIFRFREELREGSIVLMYEPLDRIYRAGVVTGGYRFDASADKERRHSKPVRWTGKVKRDVLSPQTKNSLGSIATIFCVSDEAAAEIAGYLSNDLKSLLPDPAIPESSPIEVEPSVAEADVRRDIESKALEFLQDRLVQLEWDTMQELVAGLLRSMGYKTQVSAAGADRGRDIVASPDGFGFQEPGILVEVKHRKGTIGAPDVRAFLGGLRQRDNGLFVSTGGFTREARYEAERANHHLSLLDLDGLGKAVMEHYDGMDAETRALLPLKKIYWPA